jgi:hypothetical protein
MKPTRKPNRPIVLALVLALLMRLLLFVPSSQADTATEIEHLFEYIASSGCTFVRNGNSHNNAAAVAHLRKKYTYTKRRVKTTEEFIRYTATKSSITGHPYKVICDDAETPTAQWLTDELERFRNR